MNQDSAYIFIKYLDINNIEKGPYQIPFDPMTESVRNAKDPNYNNPEGWVSFPRPERWNMVIGGKKPFQTLHFSQVTNRCGIKKILYGIDTTIPNKSIILGECDYTQPYTSLPGDPDNTLVASGINFISYQEEYRDGTTSEIKVFKSPYAPEVKIEWHANGQKKSEGKYKDRHNVGKWTWWYENGQIQKEGKYKDGKEDGKWNSWFESGNKKSEANYKDGKKVTENIHTYTNKGQLLAAVKNYKDGKQIGKTPLLIL